MQINSKEARLRLGLNQKQMASAMGIHRQTWIKWERGERKPNNAAIRLMELLLWLHHNDNLSAFLESNTIIL